MRMMKEVFILNIDDILPNRLQPRIKFDENSILELSESIKKHGVIQPIIVRKIADKYEIIAGERRYKASIVAGRKTIPAIITDINDKESAEIALIENIQREDMSPIEEALSYKKILDMGYLNQSELAQKIGKTQSTIANKIRLLNLSDEVQGALLENKISERHARSLLKLNKEQQKDILEKIINERLTVRKTDQLIDELNKKETKKEEKGDNMNNDINNNFNIPTGEILNSNNINQSNPGFMNIDNIQNNAQDINNNMSQQFDPFNTPTVNTNPFEVSAQPEASQPNPFGMPAQPEASQPNPFGMPAQSEASQPNPFGMPAQPEASQPNPFEMPAQPETSQPNPFEMPAQVEASQPNPFGMPVQPEASQPNPFEVPAQPEAPQSNPFEVPAQPFEQNNNQFSPMPNYPLPEESELKPLMPEDNIQKIQKPELPIIINKIRDCIREVENMGYKVDLDELDFDTTYQFTIKIEK